MLHRRQMSDQRLIFDINAKQEIICYQLKLPIKLKMYCMVASRVESPLHFIMFGSKFKSITFTCQWMMQGKDNGLNSYQSLMIEATSASDNPATAVGWILQIIQKRFFALQYKEARKPQSYASSQLQLIFSQQCRCKSC